MASHAPQTVLFVTNNGSVMTNGYSARLGRGQFGIIDKGAAPTALGQRVTSTIATTPKDRLFELVVGAPDLTPSKFQTNKSWKSRPFKLSEVVDVSVSAPKLGISVDKWILGYDGFNDSTAIVLQNGDNEVIDITLEGEAIGMLGYANSKVTVKLYLEAPNEGSFTMHEIVEKAVERLKAVKLKGGIPITQYIKIAPVNSENPVSVSGVDYVFYSLTVSDEGRESDLGLVQAQYPLYQVKRSDYLNGQSVYTILAPEGTVLADFDQVSVTISDPNCGEGSPSTSTVSTAWEEGDTCTAIQKNFTLQLADECDSDKLADLQAYYPDLDILIDTPNQVQTINLTGTSGTANITVAGVDYLATFNTNLSTTEQDWVTANSATILASTGTTVTYAGGLITFTAPSGTMPIISVANASGNLAGTLSAIAGSGTENSTVCQTLYRTTVFTDVVCEDCSPLLRDLFIAQAPESFEFIDWVEEAKVYDADAKMGIVFEGKENIFAGSEEYRDEIPYLYSSTRISVANEAPGMVNSSFNEGTNGRFALKLISRAQDPSGLGKDLFDLEERSRVYFTGAQRHHGNNYAKLVLGEESLLKPLRYYVVYSVRVRPVRFAQSFSGDLAENFNYLVVAEYGRHTAVETYINALATAAGLPTVSA